MPFVSRIIEQESHQIITKNTSVERLMVGKLDTESNKPPDFTAPNNAEVIDFDSVVRVHRSHCVIMTTIFKSVNDSLR